MEPVRPIVDKFVLDLLADRELGPREVFETRHGICRLGPGLARELAGIAIQSRNFVLDAATAVRGQFR